MNVQLPDSASLQRTKEAMAEVEKIARETPGVAHTVAIAGMSFLLQANASNFGSMFIVLDPFDERQAPELTRRRRSWPGCGRSITKRVKDADGRRAQFLADPRPGRRRRLQAHGRGPRRPRTGRLAATDRRADRRRCKNEPGLADASTQFRSNTPAALPGHRPDQGRSRWACRSTT